MKNIELYIMNVNDINKISRFGDLDTLILNFSDKFLFNVPETVVDIRKNISNLTLIHVTKLVISFSSGRDFGNGDRDLTYQMQNICYVLHNHIYATNVVLKIEHNLDFFPNTRYLIKNILEIIFRIDHANLYTVKVYMHSDFSHQRYKMVNMQITNAFDFIKDFIIETYNTFPCKLEKIIIYYNKNVLLKYDPTIIVHFKFNSLKNFMENEKYELLYKVFVNGSVFGGKNSLFFCKNFNMSNLERVMSYL